MNRSRFSAFCGPALTATVALSAVFATFATFASAAGCSSVEPSEEEPADPVPVQDAAAPAPDAAPPPPPPQDGGPTCTPLKFPSGVTFKTRPDADLTSQYAPLAAAPDYPLPICFIDTSDLTDPVTGETRTLDVKVGKYFTLRELVGTSLPYTPLVLLSPLLVEKLDRYRDALGEPVNVTSGFRSPPHQRAVCQEMCGKDACPGTCAARSRHSWGDAVDHGVYPKKKHSDAGCKADFNYVYREGDHVHLDLNPAHPICTVDVL